MSQCVFACRCAKVCEVIGFMNEHPSLAEAWNVQEITRRNESTRKEFVERIRSQAVRRHKLAFDLYLATASGIREA